MRIHLTEVSSNSKTGPIPVSTSSRDTCPPSCPWYEKGCYANGGPLRIHWRHVSDDSRGVGFDSFLERIRELPAGQLWRHNQAGDLSGNHSTLQHDGETNPTNTGKINKRDLHLLSKASSHTRGFTYTHYPVLGESRTAIHNRVAISRYNTPGFTINLSGDSPEHADRLFNLRIAPVTTVLPSGFTDKQFTTPGGNKGLTCPATIRDDVQCNTCKLCANYRRECIIGFPAHGSQKREIDTRLSVSL